MKAKVWGYVRISTTKQKIDRQIDNIKCQYPDAVIVSEEYTGTTLERPEWCKLEKKLKECDTVVFDEVSRMSRNATEGVELYERLFNNGVNLVFLKEPHINTEVYKRALNRHINISAETGRKAIDKYISGQGELLNGLIMDLAKEQIELAFKTAQQEVDYLHQRTSEGVRKAQLAGKQVGRATGSSIETKKAKAAKEQIKKHSRDFGGTLSDVECMKIIGVARNSYYKYKRELSAERCTV